MGPILPGDELAGFSRHRGAGMLGGAGRGRARHGGVLGSEWDNNAKPIRHKYMGDLLMVGEGGQDCFAYVALRRGGGGLAVESFGLDLISGKPEGTAILDGMIDFSRSHGPLAGARK